MRITTLLLISSVAFFFQASHSSVDISPTIWGLDKTYGSNGITDINDLNKDDYSENLGVRMVRISDDDTLTILGVSHTFHLYPVYSDYIQPAAFQLDKQGQLILGHVITQTQLLGVNSLEPLWVGFQSDGKAILRDNYRFSSDLKTQEAFLWNSTVKLPKSTFQVLSDNTIVSINDDPQENGIDTIQTISSTGDRTLNTALLGHQAGINIIHPNNNAIARFSLFEFDPCLEIYDRQGVLLKTPVVSSTPIYRPTRCNISLIRPHPDGGFIWVELGKQPSLTPSIDYFEDQSAGGVALAPGGMLRRTDKNFNLEPYFEHCTPESCPCFHIAGHYFDYTIQKDGKYVIGNLTMLEEQPKTSWPLEIARCHPDGTYDMSFGSNGRMKAFGVGGWGFMIRVQSDGKILVLSNLYVEPSSYSSYTAVRVMRFAPIQVTKQTFLPIVR